MEKAKKNRRAVKIPTPRAVISPTGENDIGIPSRNVSFEASSPFSPGSSAPPPVPQIVFNKVENNWGHRQGCREPGKMAGDGGAINRRKLQSSHKKRSTVGSRLGLLLRGLFLSTHRWWWWSCPVPSCPAPPCPVLSCQSKMPFSVTCHNYTCT